MRVDVGDVYALDAPDDTYDVVHAHQVLQHLADPVAALREMRRVCRPGGLVAVRDADYATMTWFPETAGLDDWLALYEALARRNGGEPDAGRRLKAWALEAGFEDVTASGSVWCYASPEDLAWWTGTWSERLTASSFATGARARPRRPRRAGTARRRLARLRRRPPRLVPGPARRGPRGRLSRIPRADRLTVLDHRPGPAPHAGRAPHPSHGPLGGRRGRHRHAVRTGVRAFCQRVPYGLAP